MSMTRACAVTLCVLSLAMTGYPLRTCHAEEDAEKNFLSLVAIGGRFGTNSGTDKDGSLDRVDVFWNWRTPWAWEFTEGWDVGARLEASIGALRGQGQTGAMGTFVPRLAIGDTDNVVTFDGGVGLALFSRWQFGTVEDFGGPLQFILDAGLNFRVYERLGVGYRFQHWSDGSFWGTDNRGVDMHMLEFTYRF